MLCPCGAEIPPGRARKFCSARCRYRVRDESKRVPCAGCDDQIYLGPGSRPAGEAMCNACHRAPCGSAARYKHHGCRCIPCRKANAEATAKYLPPGHKHRWISDVERISIYERDGWTCQLCGDPVNLGVHHLHREAPSLDHIEPQSHALIPNHHATNLRTAHRGCNSARGNRDAA